MLPFLILCFFFVHLLVLDKGFYGGYRLKIAILLNIIVCATICISFYKTLLQDDAILLRKALISTALTFDFGSHSCAELSSETKVVFIRPEMREVYSMDEFGHISRFACNY